MRKVDLDRFHRPPPAQAQAHPAHAQAQPPPPPKLLLPEDFGIGLVLFVMPLVKLERLPITPAEKPWIPPTTEAAKSDPGNCGSEIGLEGPEDTDGLGIEDAVLR